MTINDIWDFFDFKTKVNVKTKDGDETIGIITGVENYFETNSGKDEIELDIGDCYLAIEIPDIVSIEKVE